MITIKCLPRDDFEGGMMFWCPYCKTWHRHGRGDSHRVAHCTEKSSPYKEEGYIIKMMTKRELKNVQKAIEMYNAYIVKGNKE